MKGIKKFHISRIQITANNSNTQAPKNCSAYSAKNNQENIPIYDGDNQSSIRIRPSTPKINLLKKPQNKKQSAKDFTELIDELLTNDTNDDPIKAISSALSQMLEINEDELLLLKKILFTIDTSRHNLQIIGECLPNLVELKLNTSKICCLRNIGTSFHGLQVLWISRVGLNDLSGVSSFPLLEELYASFNFISDIYDLSYSDNLAVLDLEGNLIGSMEQLKPLRNLQYLDSLNIKGNPFIKSKEIQKDIAQLLGNVSSIDVYEDITDDVLGINQNIENTFINRLISLGLPKDKIEKAKESYSPEETQSEQELILNGIKNPKPNAELENGNISDELVVAGNAMNALRTKQKILYANKPGVQIDQIIGEFGKES